MIRIDGNSTFDRLLAWSLDNPLPRASRILYATVLIGLVALVRAMLVTSMVPWLLFLPAILCVALMIGEGTAMYASVLAALLAGVTIADSTETWLLTGPQWAGSILFVFVALGLSMLGGKLRAAFRRLRQLGVEALDREAFLSSVLASSTDCIKVLDLDGRLTFMSEGGMKVMEVSDFNAIRGCPWPDFWQDRGNADAIAALERARSGQPSHFLGKAETMMGTPKWWDVSVSPIPGADGRPARILSVSRDNTALLEAQEQQHLLNGELGHRLKNILSLVQSIANQTFRPGDRLEDASAAFALRLVALGEATNVLTTSAWQSATLDDVVRAGLVSSDGFKDRVTLTGPAIWLDAQVALALTLTLHELTTNACKYGALSNDCGTIDVRWECDPVVAGEQPQFRFFWQESGGPTVAAPTRQGFGTKMIERSLRSYFRGTTVLRYDPTGVVFQIEAPLPSSLSAIPKAGAVKESVAA